MSFSKTTIPYQKVFFMVFVFCCSTSNIAKSGTFTDKGFGSITIMINNLSDDKGIVRAGLFNSSAEFPMGKVFKSSTSIITNQAAIIKFDSLEAGYYAIALFHDKNNNKKMDYNFIGLPTEGYGFSNNAKAHLSSPSFDAAKVMVAPNAKLTMTVLFQY